MLTAVRAAPGTQTRLVALLTVPTTAAYTREAPEMAIGAQADRRKGKPSEAPPSPEELTGCADLGAHVPGLAAAFPAYTISTLPSWRGLRLVAERRAGVLAGVRLLITGDPVEMREVLLAQTGRGGTR